MKKKYSKTMVSLQAFVGRWLLNFIYNTNEWNVRGERNFKSSLENNKSVIVSGWHGTLLAPFMNLAKKNYYGLVGTNKDGEIISRIGTNLGYRILRGSSSDGGSEIFSQIIKILNNPPSVIAITPDGPRGPERIPKPGVIRAAQKTGAVIIPVASYSTKNWQFENWHTFFLEKPFGKIFLEYGNPISFKHDDNFESCKKILIDAMNEVEHKNTSYAKEESKK